MFKDVLKDLRKKNNLSQQALADIIFVSRSTIAKWENGLGLPSEDNEEQLMKYFNVSHDYLFPEIDEEEMVEINKKNRKKITLSSILSSLCSILVFTLTIVSLTNKFGIVGAKDNRVTLIQMEVPGYCINIHKNLVNCYENQDGIKYIFLWNGDSSPNEEDKYIWHDREPLSIEVHERIGFIYNKDVLLNQKIVLTEKVEGELNPRCGGIINVVKDADNVYHYFYHRPEYSGSSLVYETRSLTIEINGEKQTFIDRYYFKSSVNIMEEDCVISICGVEYNKYVN